MIDNNDEKGIKYTIRFFLGFEYMLFFWRVENMF